MGTVSGDILRSGMELQSRAKEAMADWVGSLGQWKLFVTLTMAPPSGLITGGTYDRRGTAWMRKSWRRFVELAEAILGARVSYFAVVEKHKSGVPHMHALVGYARGVGTGPDGQVPDDGKLPELARELKLLSNREIGFTRCDVLVPDKGAEYYVCKYVVKSDEMWEYQE